MSKLVAQLKTEHKVIADVLNQVNSLGISTPEAQELLNEAKFGLLSHLKKEDEQLYPVLRKEAETNEELKRILDRFSKDMDEISKVALDFFGKYENGGSGFEFVKDFGRLFSKLSQRIMKEETFLYEKYNEIVKL